MTLAQQVPDNLPARSVETSLSAPTPAAAAGSLPATLPLPSDYSLQAVILGRLKPGRVRESHRVVHVFPLTTDALHTATAALTARCGIQLLITDLQRLPRLIGMPCDHCLLHSLTLSNGPQNPNQIE